jgi:cytoskeleton protein RodZ
MAHFGEELRKEREERGIALATIVETTKVSSRHLLSLEQDRFEQLPGGVFNKGIVRSYARAIGLDEDVWVNRFLDACRQSGQLKDEDANWTEFAENVSRTRPRLDRSAHFRLRWAGVAMLLALLVVSGWLVWRYVNGRLSAESLQHPANTFTSSTTSNPSSDL